MHFRALLAVAGGVALLAGPSRADWLVLRDGSRIETRGAWETRRELVVFETAKGALSSVRLGDVDFEASRAATAEAAERAKRPAAAAEPAPRRPIATITNADVGRGVPPAPAADAAATEDAAAGEAPASGEAAPAHAGSATEKAAPALLEVVEWRRELDPTGADVLVGTLRSLSSRVVAGATLEIVLYGPDDKVVDSGRAFLADDLVKPGEVVTFRYPIAGGVAFERAELVPGGHPLALLIGDTPRKPAKEQR